MWESRTRSLEDKAYSSIREMILLGEAPSGERLAERTLAEKVGVSRTPIRQALNRLAREGVVTQIPGLGTVVNTIDPRDVEEMYELRGALEAVAAARAARRVTPAQLQYLKHLCDQFFLLTRQIKQHGWRNWSEMDQEFQDALIENDREFHTYILRVADHRRVIEIFKDLAVYELVMEKLPSPEQDHILSEMVLAWRTHRRLLRALKAGDADAARSQVQHDTTIAMETVLRRLIQSQTATVKSGLATESVPPRNGRL